MITRAAIAARVREVLAGRPVDWLAEQIAKPVDELQACVDGNMGFSSLVLAQIAQVLDADVSWLITGDVDGIERYKREQKPPIHEIAPPLPGTIDDLLRALGSDPI